MKILPILILFLFSFTANSEVVSRVTGISLKPEHNIRLSQEEAERYGFFFQKVGWLDSSTFIVTPPTKLDNFELLWVRIHLYNDNNSIAEFLGHKGSNSINYNPKIINRFYIEALYSNQKHFKVWVN